MNNITGIKRYREEETSTTGSSSSTESKAFPLHLTEIILKYSSEQITCKTLSTGKEYWVYKNAVLGNRLASKKELDADFFKNTFTPDTKAPLYRKPFLHVVETNQNLEATHLQPHPNLSYETLIKVIASCTKLESLDLSQYPDLSMDKLVNIITRRPNLKSLDLSSYDNLTDAVATAIGNASPNLESISLGQGDGEEFIPVVTEKCKGLKTIKAAMEIYDDIANTLLTDCTILSELYLRNWAIFTPDAIDLMIPIFNRLRVLSFHIEDSLFDARNLFLIAQKCRELRTLVLDGFASVTDETLDLFATRNPDLETIDLSNSTLSSCEEVASSLAKCSKLQNLNLSYLDFDGELITDDDLKKIISQQRGLRKLNVSNNDYISNKGLRHIATFCKQLTHLDISGCEINNRGVASIVNNCKELTHLSIGNTTLQITNAAVELIAEKCIRLVELNINGLDTISDDAIAKLPPRVRVIL